MARRPANKGKKCIRRKTVRIKGGKTAKRCAQFGGTSRKSSSGGRKKKCLTWSKGRTKCIKRSKR